MLYMIETGVPSRNMSGFGFTILLWPRWRDLVAKSGINQKEAERVIKDFGRRWLDACGYDAMIGATTRPLYEPGEALHAQWGEWGLEHITVPGNGCGLDLGQAVGIPEGGAALTPHNVDSMRQAYLLQLVFNWFAGAMITLWKE